jgi:hypothetical protein
VSGVISNPAAAHSYVYHEFMTLNGVQGPNQAAVGTYVCGFQIVIHNVAAAHSHVHHESVTLDGVQGAE